MSEPFLAHSEISNEIYIICGKKKYPVTEQVISAMKATGRLNERPQGEWLHPYKSDIACECSNCHRQMPITNYYHFCPNCGAIMEEIV